MKFLLPLLLTFFFLSGHAQENGFKLDTIYKTKTQPAAKKQTTNPTPTKTPDSEKGYWNFGGSFGFAFGNQTTINISPQATYNLNQYFAFGGGLSYNYYHYSHRQLKYDSHYIGANLIARTNPLRYLILQIQPEVLYRWGKEDGEKMDGKFVPAFLIGGGVSIPSGRGSVNLMFHYDVVQDEHTPYSNNIFYSVGYSISL